MLVIRGAIFGDSGYGTMVKGLVKALDKLTDIIIQPLSWKQQDVFIDSEIQKIMKKKPKEGEINIEKDAMLCVQLPADVPKFEIWPKTYVFTMLETTSIPPLWVQILNQTKGTFVPCDGNVHTFKASGVKNVDCIPLAADSEVFNMTKRKDGLVLENANKFNIFSLCQVGLRKNILELISAYCDVFGNNKDVTLFLKVYGRGYSTIEMFEIAKELMRYKTNQKAKIVLLYDTIGAVELADIYKQMHLYINTSFGESWDFPRFEALMCGIPAIGTSFIGPETYLQEKDFFIDYDLVDIEQTNDVYMEGMKWAKPNPLAIRQKMMDVYRNYDSYKEKAQNIAVNLAQDFTWEKSAKKLLELIEEKDEMKVEIIK